MSDILNSMSKLISSDDEILVIHSSLLHLKVTPEMKWELLSALKKLILEGYTIAIPSFTFSFTKTRLYDREKTFSEVGVLADWFAELYGVARTLHPIYSFYVAGPLAHEILSLPTDQCFSENSTFDFFHRHKTRIILLGCDYKYVTQFHYYEENHGVPYRYHKSFTGELVTQGKSAPISTTMYVRDLTMNPNNDFSEIYRQLETNGSVSKAQLYSGEVRSFNENDAAMVAKKLLSHDNLAFVQNKSEIIYAIASKNERNVNKPIKLAILGETNLSLLEESLKTLLPRYLTQRRIEIFRPEYGQTKQEILHEYSNLANFKPDYLFFTDTLEDLFKVNQLEVIDPQHSTNVVNDYANLIQICAEKFSGRIFVNNFLLTSQTINGNYDYSDDAGISALIQQSNNILSQFTKNHPNITIINLVEIAINLQKSVTDSRLWYIGKYRYSREFYDKLSLKYIGCVLSSMGASARVIAVDLDNTLWGGVLGEDGLEGLALGGDYPGNAYKQFQRVLMRLSQRGILLAIVSKNDEDNALDAINKHPEMVIRGDSLVAYYINWREKSDNLIDLANKLNVSLENILFVDDNPLEREKIRMNLPAIKIIDLPNDPAQYIETLLSSPYLECLQVTQEDVKRNEFFVKQNQINLTKNTFTNVNDFLQSQNIKIYINPLDKNNFSRAIQLLNKTNQFNTTTMRYSDSELRLILEQGFQVFVVGSSDILSDYENIGLFILSNKSEKTLTIESLLLSCRVLGKGIESAMLAWISQYARKHKLDRIMGEITFTARNSPVRDLYQSHGFNVHQNSDTATIWTYQLSNEMIAVPYWLQLIDKTVGEEYAS